MLFSTRGANKNMAANYMCDEFVRHVEAWVAEEFLWEPGGGNQAPDRLQVYVKTGIYWKA